MKCGTLYHIPPQGDAWIWTEWFFRFAGSFQVTGEAADTLQCNFFSSLREKDERNDLPILHFDPDHDQEEYRIVVHLRTGDIVLPKSPAFLPNIKRQFDEVLEGFKVPHYYFIAEDLNTGDGPPTRFSSLPEWFKGSRVTYLNNLSVISSQYHMMNGDALVTTGSGFTLLPSVLGWRPIVIHGQDKRGPAPPLEHHDWLMTDQDGIILDKTLPQIRSRVVMKYDITSTLCGKRK